MWCVCVCAFFDLRKFPLPQNPWLILYWPQKGLADHHCRCSASVCFVCIQCSSIWRWFVLLLYFCCHSQFNVQPFFRSFAIHLPLSVQINKRTHQKVFWFVFHTRTKKRERKRKGVKTNCQGGTWHCISNKTRKSGGNVKWRELAEKVFDKRCLANAFNQPICTIPSFR